VIRSLVGPIARRTLDVAAVGLDRVAPPGRGIVVLAYHQVGGPTPGSVNLAPAAFADQMACAAAEGRAVTLDDAADRLAIAAPPPLDPIAVTFDDGSADFVEHAVPILVQHGVPALLYVATDWIEAQRSFWDDGTVLSWAALAEALSTGLVAIGSHTHSHLLCDRMPAAEVAADLDRSIGLIEDRLGVTPVHFAYPKALPAPAGSEAAAAVAARFRTAAVAGGRRNPYGTTDLQRLSRTPITTGDDADRFTRKLEGGLRLEGIAREQLDRRRYAGATR
jgi:peptidoglycan/xylan/chitin deacetylase (PgdA/CDA1 family)